MNLRASDSAYAYRARRRAIEGRVMKSIFFICAAVSILTTVGILYSLASQAWGFFQEVGVIDFLTGSRWSPILKPTEYGVLPLVSGTVLVAILGAMVAVPVGLGTAIYLAEYAPDKARRVLKPFL
ncbi:MAG: phosphate ABC transporter permease subunit PstC, partial [Chloroflexota bacterium]|nr:phosphate ABC transporter permease subunit PstC [Chloroflexota bacterium]